MAGFWELQMLKISKKKKGMKKKVIKEKRDLKEIFRPL